MDSEPLCAKVAICAAMSVAWKRRIHGPGHGESDRPTPGRYAPCQPAPQGCQERQLQQCRRGAQPQGGHAKGQQGDHRDSSDQGNAEIAQHGRGQGHGHERPGQQYRRAGHTVPTHQPGSDHGNSHEGRRAPPTHRQRRDDLGKRHRGIHRHGLLGRLGVRRLLLLGCIGRLVNRFAAVYAHIEEMTPFVEVGVQLE